MHKNETNNSIEFNTKYGNFSAWCFSHNAMATVFQIYIIHEDKLYASQAASEVFSEIDRIELELSRFIDNSDVNRINHLLPNQSLRVGLDCFNCLKHCKLLYEKTDRVFDISIRPLYDLWFDQTSEPSEKEIKNALSKIGLDSLRLDEHSYSVSVTKPEIQIDLGGFGKGYAVDRVVEILQEWEIDTALIHAGQSSVYALGHPPKLTGWPLMICHPLNKQEFILDILLTNRAMSGSGMQKGKHILDPRNGRPVRLTVAAWSLSENAAESDAFSTLFMIMTPEEIQSFIGENKKTQAFILRKTDINSQAELLSWGNE